MVRTSDSFWGDQNEALILNYQFSFTMPAAKSCHWVEEIIFHTFITFTCCVELLIHMGTIIRGKNDVSITFNEEWTLRSWADHLEWIKLDGKTISTTHVADSDKLVLFM